MTWALASFCASEEVLIDDRKASFNRIQEIDLKKCLRIPP